jgi:hypothetical protein
MAKVTSKYQLTVPKAISDRYSILPSMKSSGFPQATRFVWYPDVRRSRLRIPQSVSGCLIRRPYATAAAQALENSRHKAGAGRDGIFTTVAALIDTKILVYRCDHRFPESGESRLTSSGVAFSKTRCAHRIRRPL